MADEIGGFRVDPNVVGLVPREICELLELFPIRRIGPMLVVAMLNPSNRSAIDDLISLTGYPILPVEVTVEAVEKAIARYHYNVDPTLN